MCTSSLIWITDRLPGLPSRQTLPRLLSFIRLTPGLSLGFPSFPDFASGCRRLTEGTLLRPKLGCHLFAIWSFSLSIAKEGGCLPEAMRTCLSSTVCQSTLGRHTPRVLSGRTLPRGRTPHPAAGHFVGISPGRWCRALPASPYETATFISRVALSRRDRSPVGSGPYDGLRARVQPTERLSTLPGRFPPLPGCFTLNAQT